jgi:large subunit ribosomal protein L21
MMPFCHFALTPLGIRTMYAIFEDGARQFMVEEGDVVQVDFREMEAGSRVEFDRVLLFHTGEQAKVGQPLLSGAKVIAEVIEHPSTKTYIQKYRRRKNYRRFKGHRQFFTAVEITELVLPGWERPKSETKPESARDTAAEGDEDEDEDEEA